MAESGRTPQARALLQQCLHARLQVRPAEGDAAAQWVEVTSAPQLLRLFSGAVGGFLPRCLGALLFRVSLRAGRVATGTCSGRCWTSARSTIQYPPLQASLFLSPQSCPTDPGTFSFRFILPAGEGVLCLGLRELELPLTFCLPE